MHAGLAGAGRTGRGRRTGRIRGAWLLVALLVLVATTGCDNWSEFGQNATGAPASSDTVISTSDANQLVPAWTAPVGGGESPAVVNGVVYAGGGTTFSALNAATGQTEWTFTPPAVTDDSIGGSPAVAGGLVYLVRSAGDEFDDGTLIALDATSGAMAWTDTLGALVGDPTVADGTAFVTSVAYTTGHYWADAVNAATGAVEWTHDLGVRPSVSFGVGSPMQPAAVADGVAYFAAPAGLVALSASTGALVWQADPLLVTCVAVPCVSEVSAPVVVDGVVYVSGSTNVASGTYSAVSAYDAADGARQWQVPGQGSLAVAGGTVYVAEVGVTALNATTGATEWADTALSAGPSLAWANGVLYVDAAVDTSDALVALDGSTGATLWTGPLITSPVDAPAISNGVIYVQSSAGTLYAYRLI